VPGVGIDPSLEEFIKLRVERLDPQCLAADLNEIKTIEVADVEKNAMTGFDGTLVNRLWFDDVEKPIAFRPGERYLVDQSCKRRRANWHKCLVKATILF
jgi:hypothetical protein